MKNERENSKIIFTCLTVELLSLTFVENALLIPDLALAVPLNGRGEKLHIFVDNLTSLLILEASDFKELDSSSVEEDEKSSSCFSLRVNFVL